MEREICLYENLLAAFDMLPKSIEENDTELLELYQTAHTLEKF